MSVAEAFAQYGAERAARPKARPELLNGGVKAPTALELKLAEKQRLSRNYKAWKRSERRRLIEAEPRLLGFIKFVRRMSAEDGDELIEAVSVCDWLLGAEADVRLLALNLIQQRADRLRLLLGLTTFSDPLPPETSVFLECRKLLTAKGRL